MFRLVCEWVVSSVPCRRLCSIGAYGRCISGKKNEEPFVLLISFPGDNVKDISGVMAVARGWLAKNVRHDRCGRHPRLRPSSSYVLRNPRFKEIRLYLGLRCIVPESVDFSGLF